jgi:hypothetical protein
MTLGRGVAQNGGLEVLNLRQADIFFGHSDQCTTQKLYLKSGQDASGLSPPWVP